MAASSYRADGTMSGGRYFSEALPGGPAGLPLPVAADTKPTEAGSRGAAGSNQLAMTSTKESMSSACLLRWLPSIVWGLAIIRVYDRCVCLETTAEEGPSTVCVKVSGKRLKAPRTSSIQYWKALWSQ